MPVNDDLELPLSNLSVDEQGRVILRPGVSDVRVLMSILTHTISEAAADLVPSSQVELVSMAVDITGMASGNPLVLTHRLDRQTRTLIFISGEATEADQPRLRGTAIFRISSIA